MRIEQLLETWVFIKNQHQKIVTVFRVPFFTSVSLWIFVPTIKKNVRTKFRNRNSARKGLNVLVFCLFWIVLGDTLPEGRGGKG